MTANVPIEQARIYVPGFIDRKLSKKLADAYGVLEIRTGFGLPIQTEGVSLEKVWHVEYEEELRNGNHLPLSPKFHMVKVIGDRVDEIVQSRTYPEGDVNSNFQRVINGEKFRITEKRKFPDNSVIYTTSYSQEDLSLAGLKFHGKHIQTLRIYDGQHPAVKQGEDIIHVPERADGTVVLSRLEGLDALVKFLNKGARFGVTVTKETQAHASNDPVFRAVVSMAATQ